tara:strand:+ start:23930 stop:24961 length:1032 start_codon:yes stop_codon:yes gene_type:complete
VKLIAYNDALHKTKWDEFASTKGTFFHLSTWLKVIQATYRFEPNYYLWEQDGCIGGILPAFRVKRPFAGYALISNPFSVSAGPLTMDPGDQIEFVDAIAKQATAAGINYIELRDVDRDIELDVNEGWVSEHQFATFEKQLTPSEEDNFLAIPNRQRAVIRKADAMGLTLDQHRDIKRFLSVYATSLRDLGTPIYPARYFEALLNFFPAQTSLFSVKHQECDLSSVLCFNFNNRLMPYYGGGTRLARNFHSYPWMYWQLMKHGLALDQNVFDFGRSPIDSGAYQFKKNLGFTPRKMKYCYLSINGNLPDLTPNSAVVKHLTSVWRHLPLPLTKTLGPLGAIYAV